VPQSGFSPTGGSRSLARAVLVRTRDGAYIFPGRGRRVLLSIYGESVRNQVPVVPQTRILRGAASAECGGRVHAAEESLKQYGSTGKGAEHSGSTGVSPGEIQSAGFRPGLQGRRGDANRRMATAVDFGPSQAPPRSADEPAD
jgi:hypothetical protein